MIHILSSCTKCVKISFYYKSRSFNIIIEPGYLSSYSYYFLGWTIQGSFSCKGTRTSEKNVNPVSTPRSYTGVELYTFARWKWVVNFTPWQLYHQERTPYPLDRRVGGSQRRCGSSEEEKSISHAGIRIQNRPRLVVLNLPTDVSLLRRRFVLYIHSNEIHNVAALIVYWCTGVSSTCFGP